MTDAAGFAALLEASRRDRALQDALTDFLAENPDTLRRAVRRIEDDGALHRALAPVTARLLPPRRGQGPRRAPFDQVGFAGAGLQKLVDDYEFQTALDVGSGAGKHARALESVGKTVTKLDLGASPYFRKEEAAASTVIGDANRAEFPERFDCVWASHVLEHQPNVQHFLRRLSAWAKQGGIIAITVPPLKFELVGGHLTLWTPALLIYNLVMAGLNCADAKLYFYGYNITAILRNIAIPQQPDLVFDSGDVRRLKPFMPPGFAEGVDGFAVAEGL